MSRYDSLKLEGFKIIPIEDATEKHSGFPAGMIYSECQLCHCGAVLWKESNDLKSNEILMPVHKSCYREACEKYAQT